MLNNRHWRTRTDTIGSIQILRIIPQNLFVNGQRSVLVPLFLKQ